jgi:hypothetical protein
VLAEQQPAEQHAERRHESDKNSPRSLDSFRI